MVPIPNWFEGQKNRLDFGMYNDSVMQEEIAKSVDDFLREK
jgi:hypothetical protein